MNTIAERIQMVRGSTSRRAFAATLGIKESTLRNYENSASLPNSDLIVDFCKILRIEPAWLLMGIGPMRPGEQPISQPEAASNTPEPCARCSVLEAENKLLREVKVSQEETIKAQTETIRMYKIALEAAQQEVFKGDHGMPVVPPSVRHAPSSTELNK